MAEQTSFDLEDAQDLLNAIEEFYRTLWQEWIRVLNQWNNLKALWRDDQFDKFEPLFEKLSATYERAIKECENYMAFLYKEIEIAEKRRHKLGNLAENIIATVETVMSGVQMFAGAPLLQIPTVRSQEPISLVQQTESNACSLEDKPNFENSAAVQNFESLPEVVHLKNTEEQLEESYNQQTEEERDRQKKELDVSTNVAHFSRSSGSPKPN